VNESTHLANIVRTIHAQHYAQTVARAATDSVSSVYPYEIESR
jgi:hypothetical protein